MSKELKKIHDKLVSCNLGDAVRVSILNPNSTSECLVCFLLLTDRFKNFDELFNAIKNCLKGMLITISAINDSKVIITINK